MSDYSDGSNSPSYAGEDIEGWMLPTPANDRSSTASSRSLSDSFPSGDEDNCAGDALAEAELDTGGVDVVDHLFDMMDSSGFETLANTRDTIAAMLDETPLPPTMKGALDGFVDGELDVHAFDDYLSRWGDDRKLDMAQHLAPGPCMRCEDGTDASADLGASQPALPTSADDTDRSAHPTKLTRPCVGEPCVREGS